MALALGEVTVREGNSDRSPRGKERRSSIGVWGCCGSPQGRPNPVQRAQEMKFEPWRMSRNSEHEKDTPGNRRGKGWRCDGAWPERGPPQG